MVWGWPIAMIFIQCVAMSMAELCSSMPTSGGLLPFLPLPVGAHWRHGLQDGQIGSVWSQEPPQSTTLFLL